MMKDEIVYYLQLTQNTTDDFLMLKKVFDQKGKRLIAIAVDQLLSQDVLMFNETIVVVTDSIVKNEIFWKAYKKYLKFILARGLINLLHFSSFSYPSWKTRAAKSVHHYFIHLPKKPHEIWKNYLSIQKDSLERLKSKKKVKWFEKGVGT